MRKQSVLLVMFSAISFLIFGQDSTKVKRHYISLNPVGISIPIGDFQSISTNNFNDGGFATTGWSGNIEGALFFFPNFGLVAQLGTMINPLNKIALDAYPNSRLESNETRESKYGNFNSYYGLIGLIGSIHFKSVSFDLKLIGGRILTFAPLAEITYTRTEPTNYTTYEYSFKPTQAENWLLMSGINSRIKIAKNLEFKASVDLLFNNGIYFFQYMEQTNNYKGVYYYTNTTITDPPTDNTIALFNYANRIITLNLGIGIAYTFGKFSI